MSCLLQQCEGDFVVPFSRFIQVAEVQGGFFCAGVFAVPYLCYLEEMVHGARAALEEVNAECGLCSCRKVSLKYYFKELWLFKELLCIKHYFKEPPNPGLCLFSICFLIMVSPPNSRCQLSKFPLQLSRSTLMSPE